MEGRGVKMVDYCRIKLEEGSIIVKLEKEDRLLEPMEPEALSLEPAVKLKDQNNESERIDEPAELEDDVVEEYMEEQQEDDEQDNPTTSGLGKKKETQFIFSMKHRTWFIENFMCTGKITSFITTEEIISEYSKAHPDSKPSAMAIGKVIKCIWGNKVMHTRRRLHSAEGKRVPGYANLAQKTKHPEPSKLSESVLCLPVSDIIVPGWSVELFLIPFSIRYRKGVEQLYVDKNPVILEVCFSYFEGQMEDGKNHGIDNNNAIDNVDKSNSNNSSGNIDKDNHRDLSIDNSNINANQRSIITTTATTSKKLCATILCTGRVISAEELDLWDNKSVPTLRKVQTLLKVLGTARICLGSNIGESWQFCSSDCLNPKEKLVVVHKCFNDVLSSDGQKKMMSVDCKIFSTTTEHYCDNCFHATRVARRRESRKKRCSNKNSIYKNHLRMTRAELEEKIKKLTAEVNKYKSREKSLQRRLSEIHDSDSQKSDDSESCLEKDD